jgi:hypothetical protein
LVARIARPNLLEANTLCAGAKLAEPLGTPVDAAYRNDRVLMPI